MYSSIECPRAESERLAAKKWYAYQDYPKAVKVPAHETDRMTNKPHWTGPGTVVTVDGANL